MRQDEEDGEQRVGGAGGGAAMREMGVKAGGNEREEMGMVAA
jgi:hypothetical protein